MSAAAELRAAWRAVHATMHLGYAHPEHLAARRRHLAAAEAAAPVAAEDRRWLLIPAYGRTR